LKIPGHHFPPVILISLCLYLLSFYKTWSETPAYEIVADELDIAASAPLEEDGRSRDTGGNDESRQGVDGAVNGFVEELNVEIKETIVLDERPPYALRTLLTGLPSPTSTFWTIVTLGTNLVAAFMAADMVYRGRYFYPSPDLSFARVGYVSESSANILIREPDASKLPLYVWYREGDVDARLGGGYGLEKRWDSVTTIYHLSDGTDFTSAVQIPRLKPLTHYEYSISNGHSGSFTTAPPTGQTDPSSSAFTFLTSSCIKPRFPYDPFSHPLGIPGLRQLAKLMPLLKARFMLFLGDFIYVDVPHRFGSDYEAYRREYRQIYASPDWEGVSHMPWLQYGLFPLREVTPSLWDKSVYDDHEIADDWDRNTTPPYPVAMNPFLSYQASVNPPPVAPGETYYSFAEGPASFFMMDTRRYRTPNSDAEPNSPEKSMLGEAQLHALLEFLSRPEPDGVHWKILISSVPFTENWRINAGDDWSGRCRVGTARTACADSSC
jgi:alkaline phosphatase D